MILKILHTEEVQKSEMKKGQAINLNVIRG